MMLGKVKKVCAPKRLLPVLAVMCSQLEKNRLDIALMKAPEVKHTEHRVRVVNSENPEWYREFCSRHMAYRQNKKKRLGKKHHDTCIKRRGVLGVLKTFEKRGGAWSPYAEELLEIAEDLIETWEEERREHEEEYGS